MYFEYVIVKYGEEMLRKIFQRAKKWRLKLT